MQKCIVLIGPPCSGKSTVGKELASQIGYKYVSSGDIARKMAEDDGTSDGLNAGKMAPEDKMRDEIAKVFNKQNNIVLDGFPRFEEQWEWMITNFEYEFAYIIVDVLTLTLFNRVILRGRADDVAFIDRLKYYIRNTVPMINRIDSHCTTYGIPTWLVMNDKSHIKTVSRVKEYLDACSWL